MEDSSRSTKFFKYLNDKEDYMLKKAPLTNLAPDGELMLYQNNNSGQ